MAAKEMLTRCVVDLMSLIISCMKIMLPMTLEFAEY